VERAQVPDHPRRYTFVTLPHLRAWRLSRLLSQAELARRARLTPETISRAENGRRITVVTARRLARALKIEREALLSPPSQQQDAQA
jgi:transcriptional regulator with XRE-family HTH domain